MPMTPNLKMALLLLGIGAAAQGLSFALPPYFNTIFLLAGINAILAVSLNVVNGLSGQFSIGHAGFMAVGAYTAASVNVYGLKALQGSPAGEQAALLIALAAAAAVSGLVGYLVGLPALRLRGDYLAIATLGVGEIIRVIILNIDAVGGARGFIGIPQSTNAFLIYVFLAFCVAGTHRLVMSTHGRALLSVREDETAAEALGVDTTEYKVRAFVLASAAAGVAGGLFAHYLMCINPATFSFMKSVEIVIMVVLGGMGSISGSLVAAVLLTLLPEALRPVQTLTHVDLRMVIYSFLLIVMMLVRPQGLFGRKEVWEMFGKNDRGHVGPCGTKCDTNHRGAEAQRET
jgi:branched-chain amino acid transport system permease protein